MDESRIQRALRQGPPFRTHYVQQPLLLSPEVTRRPPASAIRRLAVLLAVVTLIFVASLAALTVAGFFRPPTPEPSAASWTATGSMHEARFGHTAVLLSSGQVLAMGGMGERPGGWETASAELYDPDTGGWTPTGSMTQARLPGHTATLLLNGRVLVVGWGPYADLYDPATGGWTATGAMAEVRGDHTATRLADGRVLVAGGVSSSGSLASAELYDPATETWSATGSMADARQGQSATLLRNGKVLVAGGSIVDPDGNSSFETSAELYDPTTGTWSPTGSIPPSASQRAGLPVSLTATRLLDGTVLVVGTTESWEGWADVYDPVAGTWTAAPAMNQSYAGHTATPLLDGRVLVVGISRQSPSGVRTSAVLFDPARDVWIPAGVLIVAEAGDGHSATLLLDGRVLVSAGGDQDGSGGTKLYPAELYDPGSGN